MAGRVREKKLFVEIGGSGRLRPSSAALEHLATAAGVWRLVPAMGRLMVLERVVDNRDRSRLAHERAREREVSLAGVFDSPDRLISVLQFVQMAKLDGSMHIDSGEVKKTLFFRGGVYLSGRSNLQRDRLGSVLVRAGLISQQERDSVAEEEALDGARLGRRLVAKGFLATPQVYEGLRLQAEEVFYSILRLGSGSYYLVSPLDMTEVPAMLRLELGSLLMEGVQRLDESRHADEQAELHRIDPIPSDQLPDDASERIFDVYNEALRRIFGELDGLVPNGLRSELREFLDHNEAFRELFSSVELESDGRLGIGVLENFSRLEWDGSTARSEPIVVLQRGLSEMLFFLIFAAGDTLDAKVEQLVQWRVAEALEKLPRFGEA